MKATYVRVSTFEQNISRQLEGKEGEIYWDKVSGMTAFKEREDGARLLKDAEEGLIDTLQIHSIDRLGRDAIDVLQTIKRFTELGVNVKSKKEGLNTLLENGEQNPVAKLLVSVLSTLAEIDYNNRREAQREGIQKAKLEGKYKGRAPGTGLSDTDMVEKHADIVEELNKGESIRRTAKLTEKSKSTVQRVKKALERIDENS
ncbi:recombinase family protein [Fodinibius sediminis]|uniref:Site-specific DNA recombinase n=1 Tax=Fodinibius sediminis TaxID=1214077 RepID=A0A521F8S7_9BACT|nr:recombinase family protein [Fodinibius sediminis]SMO92568.1 Site-specific DNA recombinase [Fodinibius sediminis]